MSITIISGTPGCGKTSLARHLSGTEPMGVHVATDVFFRFLAHRLDPSLPDAHTQNVTVVRAYMAAAVELSSGGYAVYLDGVIGPWLLPHILSKAPGSEYVLLHAPLETVLLRARERPSQRSASVDVIRRMHKQFEDVLTEYGSHIIDTDGRSIHEVASEYRAKSATDAYVLSSA